MRALTISKSMDYSLRCNVDFKEHHLLAVIPKAGRITAVLLAPRHPEREYSYFCLNLRDNIHWYCTIEELMEACMRRGICNRFGARRLTRRYNRMKGGK